MNGVSYSASDAGEIMRISAGFFRRLLHQTAPAEALVSLANTWAPRLRKGHVTLGLSAVEHTVHVITVYVAAVSSGGHPAFFQASPAESGMAGRVAEALQTLGLREIARAFGEACCLWPAQAIATFETAAELDRAMSERAVAGWRNRSVEALDAVVWRAHGTEHALLEHLRCYEDDVLRPERGLVLNIGRLGCL